MIRRDEFLSKIAEYNSLQSLKQQMNDLEKIVDTELSKRDNIVKMLNLNRSGTSGYINEVWDTAAVNKDWTVNDGGAGRDGGTNGLITYPIWSTQNKNSTGESSVSFPMYEKTLTRAIDSVFKIELPQGTNKYAAKLLVDKYNSSGFWNIVPTLHSTNGTAGVTTHEAVRVYYNSDLDKLHIEFKLNP
jgi:hypothetical protein